MEWIYIILYTLGIVILIVYDAYFREKGKNLATKEDIEEITRKIENVKKEIEDISFKKQDKFIQYKEALVEFNKEYVLLIEYYIRDISSVESLAPDPKEIRGRLNDLVKQFTTVFHILQRASIFADNNIDEVCIDNLHKQYMRGKPLYDVTIEMLTNAAMTADDIQRFRQENTDYGSLIEDLIKGKKEFIKKRNDVEGEALDSIQQVSNLVKESLNIKYE